MIHLPITTAVLLVSLLPIGYGYAVSTAGLVAHHPLDGDLQDVSGSENHGVSILTTWTEDKFGNPSSALFLDGTGGFMVSPVNIGPSVMPQLTMVAWVRPDDDAPIRQVFSHDNGEVDRSLGIDYRGGGKGWSAFAGKGGIVGHHPVEVGKWVFLAVVYDQDAGSVQLHVNDRVVEGKGTVGEGFRMLRIGMNPGYGEYFKGAIDQVRIYGRALAPEEIGELYQRFLRGEPQQPKPIETRPAEQSSPIWPFLIGFMVFALLVLAANLWMRKKSIVA